MGRWLSRRATKFGKSLEGAKIAARPNFAFEKSSSYQRSRNAFAKPFQIFLWPFWAIPTT